MNTTRTAKLKLKLTADQFTALRQTQWAYGDALNFVSCYSFAHGKTRNQHRLQRETYADVRGQFGLPAQMACHIPRQVGATYKGGWSTASEECRGSPTGLDHTPLSGLG